MKQFNLCAAIATMLCIAPVAVSHAQSTNEFFSPSNAPLTFDDGAQPATGSIGGQGYEVIAGHAVAEGDMVLGRVDARGNVISNILGNSSRGLGVSRSIDRWDNGVIPYQYSDDISEVERSLAEQAIEHWNTNTTISLVEINDENRSEHENFIEFQSSNGCASYVGRIGRPAQELWISASCGVGSIIHELGHAVGLFHEHTRSDRDNFISVQLDNIVPGKEFNFDVLNVNVELLGEYDYGSIMHYGERFFSKNNEETIVVLDGVTQVGQRDALSELDIQSVNKLYETDLALSVNTNSDAQDNELIADISVTNQGDSGANGLSLSLRLNDGGSWRATSQNPGWDCVPNGVLLNCERDTLEATATVLFSVVAEVSSDTDSALAVELTSNTFDTDLSNNGHNATVTAESGNSITADGQNEAEAEVDTENNNGGFANPAVAEVDVEAEPQAAAIINTPGQVPESQTVSSSAIDPEDVQQSSPSILPSVDTNDTVAEASNAAAPVDLGAALPEAEIDVIPPSSSSSGGAFSPLGAFALFLLTFIARVRRTTLS